MKTKFWTILAAAVLYTVMFAVGVSAATSGNYTYTVANGEATITAVNTSISGAVTIPSTLGGYPVTSIGDQAFFSCRNLTSITIPNSVTSIGDDAFSLCDSLTSITVSSSNKNYSSVDGVLFNKDKTILIAYPVGKTAKEYTIPSSVTSIGSWAFYYCDSLTSITIPNSVTSIGNSAFFYCVSLTSITIPSSVTSIGKYAFYYCKSLTSITIPNSITSIGSWAFSDCESLTSITIPSSVTSIGNFAFSYCPNLTIYGYSGTYAETYATENSKPFVAITAAAKPSLDNSEYFMGIITSYCVVEASVPLTVYASASDGGTLSYQWYVSDTADGAGVAIPGATAAEYTFTATEVSTKYYYVIVTNTNSFGLTASAKSAVRQIIVNPKVDALPPTIFAQTDSLSVPIGESAALFVSASVSDGGTLRYQWYVSDTETGDGTAISGATDAGYAPPTNTAGVQYYYVIITNTNANATGLQTASVKSAAMELTVGAKKLYTISGSLITYGDAADVTIELLLNGEVIRTVPVADTTGSGTYSIDGVEAGTYTMRISKPKHVTREYEVTVGNP